MRPTWIVIAVGLLLGALAPAGTAHAQWKPVNSPEVINGLIEQASGFTMSELDRLEYEAWSDRVVGPFLKAQENLLEWALKQDYQTPEGRKAMAPRFNEESDALAVARFLEFKKALAAKQFAHARLLGSTPLTTPGKEQHPEFATAPWRYDMQLLERKLFYDAYLGGYHHWQKQLDVAGQKLAALSWQGRSASSNDIITVRMPSPQPGWNVQNIDGKWLAPILENRKLLDDRAALLREWNKLPYFPTGYTHMSFRLGRPQGDSYETLPFSVSFTPPEPLHAFLFLRVDAIFRPGEESAVRVFSAPSHALFVNEKALRAFLVLRTSHGVLESSISVHLGSALESPDRERVNLEATYAIARVLIETLAAPSPLAPQPEATARYLEVKTLDGTDLQPTPNVPHRCRLQATLVDGSGIPVAKARLSFRKPELGAINPAEATTDSSGRVVVEYTAPTAADMEQKKLDTWEGLLRVVEPVSEASDYAVLRVTRPDRVIAATPRCPIMPAHERYPNTIEVRCNYQASDVPRTELVVALANPDSDGLLAFEGKQGKKLVLPVEAKVPYTVTYTWQGASRLTEPVEEKIVLELPRFQARSELTISVGIDLVVRQVRTWRKPPYYPWQLEPILFCVEDAFHPQADLEKLWSTWELDPAVHIRQVSFQQSSLGSGVVRNIVAYYYKTPGMQPSYVWEPRLLAIQKMTPPGEKAPRWVIIDREWQKHTAKLGPLFRYPAIEFMRRGSFEIEMSLETQPHYDVDPENNGRKTLSFAITEFESERHQIVVEAAIPYWEWWLDAVATVTGEFPLKVKLFRAGYLGVVTTESLIGHLVDGEYDLAVIDLTGYVDVAFSLVPDAMLSKFALAMTKTNTVALHGYHVMESYGYTESVFEKPPGRKGPPQGPTKEELLKVVALAAEGTSRHYVILVEKAGLTSFEARLADGKRVEPAGRTWLDGEVQAQQRLFSGKHVHVLGAQLGEEITLALEGSGTPGKVYTASPFGVHSFEYPGGSWKARLQVHGNGEITRSDAVQP